MTSERKQYRQALRRARYYERYWSRGIRFTPGWMRKRGKYVQRPLSEPCWHGCVCGSSCRCCCVCDW